MANDSRATCIIRMVKWHTIYRLRIYKIATYGLTKENTRRYNIVAGDYAKQKHDLLTHDAHAALIPFLEQVEHRTLFFKMIQQYILNDVILDDRAPNIDKLKTNFDDEVIRWILLNI